MRHSNLNFMEIKMNSRFNLVLIVPVFNEEDSVALFVSETQRILKDYLPNIFLVFMFLFCIGFAIYLFMLE